MLRISPISVPAYANSSLNNLSFKGAAPAVQTKPEVQKPKVVIMYCTNEDRTIVRGDAGDGVLQFSVRSGDCREALAERYKKRGIDNVVTTLDIKSDFEDGTIGQDMKLRDANNRALLKLYGGKKSGHADSAKNSDIQTEQLPEVEDSVSHINAEEQKFKQSDKRDPYIHMTLNEFFDSSYSKTAKSVLYSMEDLYVKRIYGLEVGEFDDENIADIKAHKTSKKIKIESKNGTSITFDLSNGNRMILDSNEEMMYMDSNGPKFDSKK